MTACATIADDRAGRSRKGVGEGAQSLSPVTFTMPAPPSLNQIFRNVRGRGRVKTAAYDGWRAEAVASIRRQHVPAVTGRVLVIFGVERMSLRADIDNRIKAMLDAIQDAGVIQNDNLVTGFSVAWQPPANGLAHIQIRPVSRLDLVFYPSPDGSSGGWFLKESSDPDDPRSATEGALLAALSRPNQTEKPNGSFDQ